MRTVTPMPAMHNLLIANTFLIIAARKNGAAIIRNQLTYNNLRTTASNKAKQTEQQTEQNPKRPPQKVRIPPEIWMFSGKVEGDLCKK